MSPRPLVLLCAHGERGGARTDLRLHALARELGDRLAEADVGSVPMTRPDLLPSLLEGAGDRPVIGLPLLFSDGFFFRERLAPHFDRATRRLAPPLVHMNGFAETLAEDIRRRGRGDGGVTLLVAHGSKAPGRSEACARALADIISAAGSPAIVGFLEQAPLARDVVREVAGRWTAVGLLMGEGRHGRDDFQAILAEAPVAPAAAFLAGDVAGLADVLAQETRRQLARPPES
jgi:hypothetical protein